jgi:hypothetical protein
VVIDMKKWVRNLLLITGFSVIGLTHLYMLIAGLPASMMVGHAVVNLSAGVLLAFAVFSK